MLKYLQARQLAAQREHGATALAAAILSGLGCLVTGGGLVAFGLGTFGIAVALKAFALLP